MGADLLIAPIGFLSTAIRDATALAVQVTAPTRVITGGMLDAGGAQLTVPRHGR